MSKNKTKIDDALPTETDIVQNTDVLPTETDTVQNTDVLPTETEPTHTDADAPVQSEAEMLFDEVMAESGEQLIAEVQADVEKNGIQLTPEESAEIKKITENALSEAARIRNLSPDEYEAEFGFKFMDGISIAEHTIQKSEHVHKDRIFGLLQKIRELYVG